MRLSGAGRAGPSPNVSGVRDRGWRSRLRCQRLGKVRLPRRATSCLHRRLPHHRHRPGRAYSPVNRARMGPASGRAPRLRIRRAPIRRRARRATYADSLAAISSIRPGIVFGVADARAYWPACHLFRRVRREHGPELTRISGLSLSLSGNSLGSSGVRGPVKGCGDFNLLLRVQGAAYLGRGIDAILTGASSDGHNGWHFGIRPLD
jgi:hypothetical protein